MIFPPGPVLAIQICDIKVVSVGVTYLNFRPIGSEMRKSHLFSRLVMKEILDIRVNFHTNWLGLLLEKYSAFVSNNSSPYRHKKLSGR